MVRTLFRIALRAVLILGCASSVIACTDRIVGWREDVKISDGRTIAVDRKSKCGTSGIIGGSNCVAEETWMTFNLPEFGQKPIVWHETGIFALVLNIQGGNLYVAGYPRTVADYKRLGSPKCPYITFMWQAGQWKRIPVEALPPAIYARNLFVGDKFDGGDYLPLERKNGTEDGMLGSPAAVPFLNRIDPTYNPA